MKTKLMKIKILTLSTLYSAFAYSAGLEKVNEIMEKVKTAMTAAAVVTVTVAILWAGYKVLFGGQTLREVAPILIGGLLIGSALQLAQLLVG